MYSKAVTSDAKVVEKRKMAIFVINTFQDSYIIQLLHLFVLRIVLSTV